MSSYISQKFIKENNLDTIQLPFPITCYNADGTANKNGSITEVIRMNMIIGDCKGTYPRVGLSDVSRFLPKSHHLSDRLPTVSLPLS